MQLKTFILPFRFETLESDDIDGTSHWMKYWIVFGMLRAMENIGDSLICWIPGYLFLKVRYYFEVISYFYLSDI